MRHGSGRGCHVSTHLVPTEIFDVDRRVVRLAGFERHPVFVFLPCLQLDRRRIGNSDRHDVTPMSTAIELKRLTGTGCIDVVKQDHFVRIAHEVSPS